MLIFNNINEDYQYLPYHDSLIAIIVGDKFPEEYNLCLRKYSNIYLSIN